MRRNIQVIYDTPDCETCANATETPQPRASIYFYTHWGAEGLEEVLAGALKRGKSRWNDESYLARIIFTDMTADAGDDITGYGIAPYCMDDQYPTLVVDMKAQTVNDIAYEDFIAHPEVCSAYAD